MMTLDQNTWGAEYHTPEVLLHIFVEGVPATQGSVKSVGRTKTGVPILVNDCKKNKSWRKIVSGAVKLAYPPMLSPILGPACVVLNFVMPRPLCLSKNKPTPPLIKKTGDLDKLVRSIFDGITDAGLWKDDCQVVSFYASKRTAEIGEKSGVFIIVKEAAQ